MGIYLSIPVLALAAVLQTSVIPQLRVQGGAPDLIFLIVLSWGVRSELVSGLAWAFVGGIFQDVLSAAPTGTSALGMVLLIFAIGGMGEQLYRIGVLLLIGLVVLGTLLKQVMILLVLLLAGYQLAPIQDFTTVVLPTLVYNLVLIWPVYWFMRWFKRRFDRDERLFRE